MSYFVAPGSTILVFAEDLEGSNAPTKHSYAWRSEREPQSEKRFAVPLSKLSDRDVGITSVPGLNEFSGWLVTEKRPEAVEQANQALIPSPGVMHFHTREDEQKRIYLTHLTGRGHAVDWPIPDVSPYFDWTLENKGDWAELLSFDEKGWNISDQDQTAGQSTRPRSRYQRQWSLENIHQHLVDWGQYEWTRLDLDRIENLDHIYKIEEQEREEIVSYCLSHPGLANLLHKVYIKLSLSFHDNIVALYLSLFKDPEEDNEWLSVHVQTTLPPREAIAWLQRFDKWWLNIDDENVSRVNVMVRSA